MTSTQRPVQIIYLGRNGKLEFDYQAASTVLKQDDIARLPIAVISVAGATRTGKSFLLSFFLRYLELKGQDGWHTINNSADGFSWAGGDDRHTVGIWIWSKVFKVETSGGPVGVLLMDSQGIFDVETTYEDNVTVFALSTMMSSVQIYNVPSKLKEDDLENLRMFTEYGAMALESGSSKQFQKIIFLIRDFFVKSYSFGWEGGKQYLTKLMSDDKKPEPGVKLRQHIKQSFEELSCFLMPFPGDSVASCTNKQELADIRPDFLSCLDELCSYLFKPENLTVKKMHGQQVIASDLADYMRVFSSSDIFRGNISAKSFYDATAESFLFTLARTCGENYKAEMDEMMQSRPHMMPEDLRREHERLKETTVESFRSARKFGEKSIQDRFEKELHANLDHMLALYEVKVYHRLMDELGKQKKKLEENNELFSAKAKEIEKQLSKVMEEAKEAQEKVQRAEEKAGSWFDPIVEGIGFAAGATVGAIADKFFNSFKF